MATTTRLSIADAVRLARAAGFPRDQLVTAVAVAKAESQLNPRAKNDNPGTGDYSIGLWQINMRPEAHGTRFGTELQLMVPANNARAAFQVWRDAGNSWRPWSVYKDGGYQTHVAEVATVVDGGVVTTLSGGGAQLFAGIPDGDDIVDAAGDALGVLVDPIGAGRSAVADILGLDNLMAQILTVAMTLVFSAAAMALVALGLWRLTGVDAGKLFEAGSKAAGVGGIAKAVI